MKRKMNRKTSATIAVSLTALVLLSTNGTQIGAMAAEVTDTAAAQEALMANIQAQAANLLANQGALDQMSASVNAAAAATQNAQAASAQLASALASGSQAAVAEQAAQAAAQAAQTAAAQAAASQEALNAAAASGLSVIPMEEGMTAVDYYVVVSSSEGELRFRTGPGAEYPRAVDTVYHNGDILHILVTATASSGNPWGFTMGGAGAQTPGWVALNYTQKLENISQQAIEQVANANQAAATLQAQGITVKDVDYYVTVDSTDGTLGFRTGPGAEYARAVDAVYHNGDVLHIVKEATAASGNPWGLTLGGVGGGVPGWCALNYTKKISAPEGTTSDISRVLAAVNQAKTAPGTKIASASPVSSSSAGSASGYTSSTGSAAGYTSPTGSASGYTSPTGSAAASGNAGTSYAASGNDTSAVSGAYTGSQAGGTDTASASGTDAASQETGHAAGTGAYPAGQSAETAQNPSQEESSSAGGSSSAETSSERTTAEELLQDRISDEDAAALGISQESGETADDAAEQEEISSASDTEAEEADVQEGTQEEQAEQTEEPAQTVEPEEAPFDIENAEDVPEETALEETTRSGGVGTGVKVGIGAGILAALFGGYYGSVRKARRDREVQQITRRSAAAKAEKERNEAKAAGASQQAAQKRSAEASQQAADKNTADASRQTAQESTADASDQTTQKSAANASEQTVQKDAAASSRQNAQKSQKKAAGSGKGKNRRTS